jgi:hypothetical protein
MKKILTLAVLVMGLGGVANAASSQFVGVLESSITTKLISISSSVATDVCTGIEMPDRTSFVLQNINTTYDVQCAASATDLALGNYFILYAGGGTISLNLRPYSAKNTAPLKIFCKTTSTVGATGITVIQAY